MALGITSKLFIAVLLTNVVTAVAVGFGVRAAFDSGFEAYVQEREAQRLARLAGALADTYRDKGGWEFLRDNDAAWLQLNRQARPDRREGFGPPVLPPAAAIDANAQIRREGFGFPTQAPFAANDPNAQIRRARPEPRPPRALVYDAAQKVVVGDADPALEMSRHPISVNGQVVGWLASPIRQTAFDFADHRFQQQQWRASASVALMAMGLAAIVAWFLSRGLLAPVKRLASATRKLADGEYSTRVAATSTDELGRLTDDFNRLGNALEKHEASRRNFMADVSHELRTPLAVLKGELEALEDGVRDVSPATIHSLQAEVARLGKLVNDIHDLSLADVGGLAYRFKPTDLGEALRDSLRLSKPRFTAHGLALDAGIPPQPVYIRGDEERLAQLFANLVENSLRYTDADGKVRVSLRREANQAVIDWEDSKPGVPEGALPRLFERLFRVEESRSRQRGGSGLGLAICRSIAQAHGGSIVARASELGGLQVILRLPLSTGSGG
jgi:two-component system, OmpR family, sensor histidine kinase BaeS